MGCEANKDSCNSAGRDKPYLATSEGLFSSPVVSRAFFEAIPYAAMLIHRDRIILAANKAAINMGVVPGTNCWNTFGKLASIPEQDRKHFEQHGKAPECGTMCVFCEANQALDTQRAVIKVLEAGGVIYETYWVPVSKDVYLHYAVDITGKKADA